MGDLLDGLLALPRLGQLGLPGIHCSVDSSVTMRGMGFRLNIGDIFWQPIRGSLILSLVLVFLDAVVSGSYLYSLFICPIWFFVALVRAAAGRASLGIASARILIPVITGLVVVVNASVQNKIAKSNAVRIVEACEQYQKANGVYPEKLDDLVPRFLSSVPRAKYCFMWNDFWYRNFHEGPSSAMLHWVETPPFGRPTYSFERRDWGYID